MRKRKKRAIKTWNKASTKINRLKIILNILRLEIKRFPTTAHMRRMVISTGMELNKSMNGNS